MGALIGYVRRHHVALLALFVALGGSAYAAKKIGSKGIKTNAVKSRHIAPGQVTPGDVQSVAVTSVKANPLTAADPCSSGQTGVLCGFFDGGPSDGNYENAPGYTPAAFYKDVEGLVHLEGVVRVTSLQATTIALVLPSGYRPAANPRTAIRGDLTAIEFVPDDFRILGPDEMRQPPPRIVAAESVGPDGAALPGPRPVSAGDGEKRREAILQAIRSALRAPATGEKREMGHLERVECTGRAVFFHLRTAGGTIKLGNRLPDGPDIRVFTPDLNGLTIGCLFSPVDYPTVFIYKDAPDARAKTAGTIVSFDFVPKSFVLD